MIIKNIKKIPYFEIPERTCEILFDEFGMKLRDSEQGHNKWFTSVGTLDARVECEVDEAEDEDWELDWWFKRRATCWMTDHPFFVGDIWSAEPDFIVDGQVQPFDEGYIFRCYVHQNFLQREKHSNFSTSMFYEIMTNNRSMRWQTDDEFEWQWDETLESYFDRLGRL